MCAGAVPLRARLEPWHEDLAARPERIADWMAAHGSPLNLIEPAPMGRNAAELTQAASARGLDLRIFFARKANKALALVDEAMSLGLGVDVASEQELRQALERGVPAEDIVVTAAIKPTGPARALRRERSRSGDRQRRRASAAERGRVAPPRAGAHRASLGADTAPGRRSDPLRHDGQGAGSAGRAVLRRALESPESTSIWTGTPPSSGSRQSASRWASPTSFAIVATRSPSWTWAAGSP